MVKFLKLLVPVLVVFALLVAAFKFGLSYNHSGDGTGEGSGASPVSSVSINIPSESNQFEDNLSKSEIRIEINTIYLDGEPCSDAKDLKQKITDIGAEREYTFIHENAIKDTYDQVDEVLTELKNALGIIVEYKTH